MTAECNTSQRRRSVVDRVEAIAAAQGGVASRQQLAAAGVGRHAIEREVARGRWTRRGRRTVAIHRGPLPRLAVLRTAIWEIGGHARLDGPTALELAGMTGFEDTIHVSIPRSSSAGSAPGVHVHQLRGWCEADTTTRSGIFSTKAATAAIHAALWVPTRRQAALVLAMAVQQRLVTGSDLASTLSAQRRARWRALLLNVINDITAGAHSLGELDVAREFRRRGLPEPTRQVIRTTRRGRAYLDVYFDEFGLVVEIDGAHHLIAANVLDDALRSNELVIASEAVIRIPLLAWRVDPTPFVDQVGRALRARGWDGC